MTETEGSGSDVPFEEPEQPAEPAEASAGELVAVDADVVSLFGPGGVEVALARVERYADALKAFVKEHELTLEMEDGSDYVLTPGWEALGQMLGIFAAVEQTERVEGGWKARAFAHRFGERLTAREAICLRAEFGKERKPEMELHAMAQTRACRNALKAALNIVVNAAGFDTAPPEERPATPRQRAMLFAILNRLERLYPRGRGGWKAWTTDATMRRYGKRISGLNRRQMGTVIDGMGKLAGDLAETPRADRSFEPEALDEELADADRSEP